MGLKRDILISLVVFGVLLLILAVVIGIVLLAMKAVGIVLILIGIFLAFFFPDARECQMPKMSKSGIVIGIILAIIGIALLIFV